METLFLIPPMGHNELFYKEIGNELSKKFNIVYLSYPRQACELAHSTGDILEDLALYFAGIIELHSSTTGSILGLSLGATLSVRIKEILPKKINTLFMMASGGLKVARARKSMIYYALDKTPPREFIKKALGLTHFDEFKIHFSKNHDIALEYFNSMNNGYWGEEETNLYSIYFIEQIKAALEVNFESQLEAYQDDIVFIWGEADKIFSLRHYKKFQKLMPRASFNLMQNLGHYLPLESPKQTAKIILNYEKR